MHTVPRDPGADRLPGVEDLTYSAQHLGHHPFSNDSAMSRAQARPPDTAHPLAQCTLANAEHDSANKPSTSQHNTGAKALSWRRSARGRSRPPQRPPQRPKSAAMVREIMPEVGEHCSRRAKTVDLHGGVAFGLWFQRANCLSSLVHRHTGGASPPISMPVTDLQVVCISMLTPSSRLPDALIGRSVTGGPRGVLGRDT